MNPLTELILKELKDLPPYPWSLKLNKKTGLTEVLDLDGNSFMAFKRNDKSLIVANFICHAPMRFEEMVNEEHRS